MLEMILALVIILLTILSTLLYWRTKKLTQQCHHQAQESKRFHDFIETIPLPLFLKTTQGITVNKAFQKAFGAFSKEAYDALALLPKNSEQTIPLTFDNNIIKNVHVFNASLWDEQNTMSGFAGAICDITPLFKSKELLLGQKERLALALDGSGDGVWDWNVKKEHFFFSKYWKEVMGYDEDDKPSSLESWLNLVHPKDMAMVNVKIAALLQGQSKVLFIEHRLRNVEPLRWIAVRGKVIVDTFNQVNRVVGTIRDISARKMSEEKEHKQLSLFFSFFELLPAIAFVKNDQGAFIYLNGAYQRFIGFKTWSSKSSLELFDAKTALAIEESDRLALYEGKIGHKIDLPTIEGTLESFQVYKFSIEDDNGQKYLCGFGVPINKSFS